MLNRYVCRCVSTNWLGIHTLARAYTCVQAGRRVCVRTCVPTYPHTPPTKSQKVGQKRPKRRPPHRDFKSFRSSGRQREMDILSKPSAHAAYFSYLCGMMIEIHNTLMVGLNVGFEFYSEDDFGDYQDFYELHINLLLIKIVLFWNK